MAVGSSAESPAAGRSGFHPQHAAKPELGALRCVFFWAIVLKRGGRTNSCCYIEELNGADSNADRAAAARRRRSLRRAATGQARFGPRLLPASSACPDTTLTLLRAVPACNSRTRGTAAPSGAERTPTPPLQLGGSGCSGHEHLARS